MRHLKKLSLILLSVLLFPWFLNGPVHAVQSAISEAEGYACMGDDKSKKQTELEALANAKRRAAEYASTHIKSETRVKDLQLEKDLIDAYANATVKVVQEIEKSWYRDAASGDCFKVRIKAEVIPDDRTMEKLSQASSMADNPDAPLTVKFWTDKKEYRQSEKIRIYLRGNKPFYARVLYRDVRGGLLQLLPNPYRNEHYFNGGVIYEIPSGDDRYELEVSPPFGEESIMIYASSSPLGEIRLQATGGIYQVKTTPGDVGKRTRGISIKAKGQAAGKETQAADFFETRLTVKTQP